MYRPIYCYVIIQTPICLPQCTVYLQKSVQATGLKRLLETSMHSKINVIHGKTVASLKATLLLQTDCLIQFSVFFHCRFHFLNLLVRGFGTVWCPTTAVPSCASWCSLEGVLAHLLMSPVGGPGPS